MQDRLKGIFDLGENLFPCRRVFHDGYPRCCGSRSKSVYALLVCTTTETPVMPLSVYEYACSRDQPGVKCSELRPSLPVLVAKEMASSKVAPVKIVRISGAGECGFGNVDREVHVTRMYTSYYLYNLPVSFEPRSYGSPMCYTHVCISNKNQAMDRMRSQIAHQHAYQPCFKLGNL